MSPTGGLCKLDHSPMTPTPCGRWSNWSKEQSNESNYIWTTVQRVQLHVDNGLIGLKYSLMSLTTFGPRSNESKLNLDHSLMV